MLNRSRTKLLLCAGLLLLGRFATKSGCREMQNRLIAGNEKQFLDCTGNLLLLVTVDRYQDFRLSASLALVAGETLGVDAPNFGAKSLLTS